MHGGVKIYRGNAAAARSYVEADHGRVDDYYLADGTGLANGSSPPPTASSRPALSMGTATRPGWRVSIR